MSQCWVQNIFDMERVKSILFKFGSHRTYLSEGTNSLFHDGPGDGCVRAEGDIPHEQRLEEHPDDLTIVTPLDVFINITAKLG